MNLLSGKATSSGRADAAPVPLAPAAGASAPVEVAGVILAAREGAHLGEPSRPLARVAGVSLLERAVKTLRAAGIRRVIVVTGHAKEAVERLVAERDLDVELVENGAFPAGHSSSAPTGAGVAGNRFLLMLGDRLVEPEVIRRMLASHAPLAMAVDTQPAHCDVTGAPKVRLADGAVAAVGRDLDAWDAVDVGIVVCEGSVLLTAEGALAAGDGAWDAAKRRWLAEGGRVEAVDLAGGFWLGVDTPADVRRAERLVLARATSKPFDGLVSRRLNRPLSKHVSLLLARSGVAPTTLTLAIFSLTLAAAAVVALGARWPAALVIGGLLVQLVGILDGCDGEVARGTLRTSRLGAFLDSVLDRIGDVALLLALAVAAGLEAHVWAALVAALAGALLVPYVKAAYEAGAHASFPPLRYSFGRDARLLTIAVGAVLLQPLLTLLLVAAVSAAEAAVRITVAVRTIRSGGRAGQ